MLLGTFLAIAVVLVFLSLSRFEVKSEIEIDASAEEVWNAIVEMKAYRNWNSQLEFLGGAVKPGEKIHLRLSVEGSTPYTFQPTISHWEPYQRFGWLARTGLPKVFDGEHFFELKQLTADRTKVVNREVYQGVLAPIMKRLPMMKNAQSGFDKMNIELKNYIENQHTLY